MPTRCRILTRQFLIWWAMRTFAYLDKLFAYPYKTRTTDINIMRTKLYGWWTCSWVGNIPWTVIQRTLQCYGRHCVWFYCHLLLGLMFNAMLVHCTFHLLTNKGQTCCCNIVEIWRYDVNRDLVWMWYASPLSIDGFHMVVHKARL